MGTLLALLLGVAAGFFVLAMPNQMLETVTTTTRLSKLMFAAEPPISPNDKITLSLVAGVLTAGIGWVLVDWLMFGRAGISTIIRTREDDYEDEGEDHFRPTDPLDLVASPSASGNEWPAPSSGDARRPLSARTDIGDPPLPSGAPLSGLTHALPPIGEILPGAGMSAPPLQPNAQPPSALPPLVQPSSAAPLQPAAPAWPPLDLGAAQQIPQAPDLALDNAPSNPISGAPAAGSVPPPAGLPSWMPAPGARPELPVNPLPMDPLPAAFYEDPAEPSLPDPSPLPLPEAAIPEPEPLVTPQDIFSPPPLIAPSLDVPAPAPPIAAPAHAFVPPEPIPAPVAMPEPPVTAPPLVAPPAIEPIAQPAIAEPVAQVAPTPATAPPLRPMPEPGFDRGQLEALLVRLERGLQQRRAVAAAAQAAPSAAPVQAPQPPQAPPPQAAPIQVAPVQAVPAPVAAPPVPPAELIPTPPAPEPVIPVAAAPAMTPTPASIPEPVPSAPPLQPHHQPIQREALPPAFTAPAPVAAPSILPLPMAANEPAELAPIIPPQQPVGPAPSTILPMPPAMAEGQKDEMLDQPLHVTLDLLRSMVKR